MNNLICIENHHAAARRIRPASERTRLTPREIECVEMAYLSNADIALALGISTNTVRANLRSVFLKLQVSTRTEAFRAWIGESEARRKAA